MNNMDAGNRKKPARKDTGTWPREKITAPSRWNRRVSEATKTTTKIKKKKDYSIICLCMCCALPTNRTVPRINMCQFSPYPLVPYNFINVDTGLIMVKKVSNFIHTSNRYSICLTKP